MASRGVRREAIHMEGPTVGYAMATELTKKIGVIVPFLQWPLVAIFAFLLHQFWPDNMYVLAFLGVASLVFSFFCWYLTHDRKGLASEHAVFTVLSYGTVLGLVDHMGWTRFTTFVVVFGVFLICCSWSMRNIIRHHDEKAGTDLNSLFTTAGMDGTKMHLKPDPDEVIKRWALPAWAGRFRAKPVAKEIEAEKDPKVVVAERTGKVRREPVNKRREGKIILKPGETVEDLEKRIGSIESAAGVPPGTMVVTKDMDNARYANAIISDPRTLNKPQLYPGPSYSYGASIADTISVGLYQDGTEMEFNILGLQIQVMGMIGSGKSLGAGWSALAEIITRSDVIVWGVDVTKGEQTLGPLAPALHRLATTPDEAKILLQDAHSLIKPRTDYLAKKGLTKWQKGCGLKYLVVWLEEVPDIIEALQAHDRGELSGEDYWIKSVKAARSAGITFVWSLQRADAEQVPIIARGQAAKWCFGVSDSLEASFGLSKVQDNAGCEPENWGNRHPGKCYLDAPSIPENKIPMAGRTWFWGPDASMIRAHAEKYPADDREPDEVMLKVLARTPSAVKAIPVEPTQDTIDERVNNDEMVDDDVITDNDLDAEDSEPLANDFSLGQQKVDPMPTAAARQTVRNWLVARAGQTIRNADLTDVRKSTGYGRSWGYKVLGEFEDEGLISRVEVDGGIGWVVTDLDSVLSQTV